MSASLLWLAATADADAAAPYLAELQQSAKALNLSADIYWHKLLHYRANPVGSGVTSTLDARDFFLSPSGPTDPAAELQATLASFFSEELVAEEPAQCRKIARYQWLKRRLSFDAARLPEQDCALYREFEHNVRPSSVALVFAASDLNGPATMFGHTLLRFDRAGQNSGPSLLAQAINYAATVTGRNPLSYTVLGLTGGFVGQYSVHPYHEKVKEYVRISYRDLWEYPLQLADADLQRLTWHLWELRAIGSDYYFFTENCSYMLLTLVEAAWEDGRRPSTAFSGLFPVTIPVDTLRAFGDAGVLGEPVFRPSMARSLAHKLEALAPELHDWVLAYAAAGASLDDPALTGAAPMQQARALEAANDYLNYLFQTDALPREQALPASRRALLALSKVPSHSQFPPGPQAPLPPERGHDSARLSFGVRADEDRRAGVLRWRPAYHDRLDPPEGYLSGSQIEVFNAGLLLREEVRVSDLQLVSVQSLTPWDRAFRPWLWQAAFGARRFGLEADAADPQSRLGYFVDGGLGYATGKPGAWHAYAFGFASLDMNSAIENGYGLAGGLRTGVTGNWSSRWTQELRLDWLGSMGGAARSQLRATLETQWQMGHDHGLRLSLHRLDFDGAVRQSAELRWNYYYW